MDSLEKNQSDTLNTESDKSLREIQILEEARKLKSVFLDNMSHELRTPITVILGYAGILFEEIEDPDLKEMAEIILKSSNRLTESLNLLLDQSDVDSQKLKVEFDRINLSDFMNNTYNVFKPVVEDKGLKFDFELKTEETYSNLDPKMLDKVMSNLLNNAVKFTETGSIKIQLENSACDKNTIKIIDTGIGIPEDKQSLIFEAFRQVSEGMNRLFQGTGLGLSVTKKFVELMNGGISVESKVDSGTTFTIDFPKID